MSVTEHRVAVTGGRDFRDCRAAEVALFAHWTASIRAERRMVLIVGDAGGADECARSWARQIGVPVEVYAADWLKHGRAAGPIRNGKMLREGRPSVLIAFPGGRGTADCVRQARRLKIDVIEIPPAPSPSAPGSGPASSQ